MITLFLFWVLAASASCGHQEQPQEDDPTPIVTPVDKDVPGSGIVLPETLTVYPGQLVSFQYSGQYGPKAGDMLYLTPKTGGSNLAAPIQDITGSSCTVVMPKYIVGGITEVSLLREGMIYKLGKVTIVLKEDPDRILPDANVTVYGRVTCNGAFVPGVKVSDGISIVTTDEKGVYQLVSDKRYGYVFITVPSGYAVKTEGALAKFYDYLDGSTMNPERHDFVLVRQEQEKHTIIMVGDPHMANMQNDREQFKEWVSDVTAYASTRQGQTIYGVTLGDMAWDEYWISNSYTISNFRDDLNQMKAFPFYCTIGNHDHELEAAGDFDTVRKYRSLLGPNYYSIDIGKIHYLSIDDILCTNNGKGGRTYNKCLSEEEIAWLRKDLSYVDKSTQLVMFIHVPLADLTDKAAILDLLKDFDKPVQIFSAHNHRLTNTDKLSSAIPYYDHDTPAMGGSLWWCGYLTPGINLCKDGCPAGYRILDVDGENMTWVYKSTGKPLDHQFRTYDRNQMDLSADKYIPSASSSNMSAYNSLASGWIGASTANEVYIVVWDNDGNTKVEVTENGTALPVTSVSKVYDPLHIICYPAKLYNSASTPTAASLKQKTVTNSHTYRVVASSATTTLEVKVTDRFGNVWTETMKRPKAFNEDTYR